MSDTSGSTRSRVRSFPALAAAVTALTLVVAGCGGGDAPEENGEASGPQPDETYSGVVAAAEAPAPDGFTAETFEKIRIDVPDGWATEESGDMLCMRPPGESECGYGSIQVLPKVAKNDPNKWPTKGTAYNKDGGWASETGTCRSLNTWEDGDVEAKQAKLQSWDGDGTVKLADDLKANHRVWTVTCENGDTFEVRLWLLPTSDVAVYAWSVDAQYAAVYDKVAESMNTEKYKR
ncbi:hypothetical protein HNR23_000447 [Nocardiopsis mwathae]|uniref:DUF3558 domain-containing protein n=1 Tax=Nocardiopsis mwathae TaxID=1472723 RepID=A0A7X0D3N3_9ACTN|nr:hypothetical protein [Nocardiopsis mwathae]MBB6170387.1 hypothetical protein [Nocardiopsis mwathae]